MPPKTPQDFLGKYVLPKGVQDGGWEKEEGTDVGDQENQEDR